MQVAVISDIHGNLAALDAVLDDLAQRRPDLVVVAGDLVNRCPQSAAVVDRLLPLGYPTVKGNHERYVLDAACATDPQAGGDTFEPARWAMRQLTPTHLAYLADLPFSVWVDDLLIVHGSPRGDQDGIFLKNSDTEVREKLAGYTRVVCGHTHLSLVRAWSGGILVNAGSVGNPFEGDPRARYAWLERWGDRWQATIIALPYDVQATLAAFDASDYLTTAGPLARLFRLEVQTGSNHLIPAYLACRDLVDANIISLADAAARYLDTM